MKVKLLSISIVYALFVLSYLFVLMIDKNLLIELAKEDGAIENVGAGLFLVSSSTFLFLYFRSKGRHNMFFGRFKKRNLYFGLLAILFFVCFGEEISWGQRIFEWQTP